MAETDCTGRTAGMENNVKATILIADSSSADLALMRELLQGRYDVKLAASGADALRLAAMAPRPDLILLGASLPDMDARAVLDQLRGDLLTAGIAVIVVACADRPADEGRAWRDGAADVVVKPVVAEPLRARVAIQLELKSLRASRLQREGKLGTELDGLAAEPARAAVLMQDATILAMATLAEADDPNIGNHLLRTQACFTALARELRFHAGFGAELTDANIALMARAAPLHDIGKATVPEAILKKPGRLTADEFNVMKRHTVQGRDAIAGVEKTLGTTTPFLRYAREITWSHHEKWDGSGYPEALEGVQIPLAARVMAVVDVYDALISKRSYKPAFTHETAVELIRQGRGEHFDPDIVDAMLVIEERLRAIAAEFTDPE
jgi:putative two-component system response regulator